MAFLVIIPSRLQSTRLPNKPLANIAGKSMIQRVYEQALKLDDVDVLVACDGKEIADEVESFGGKAIITNPILPSGTDRIFAALEKIPNIEKIDFVINLQGDLPLVEPNIIKQLADVMANSNIDMATLACKASQEEADDPNIVKIAINFMSDDFGKALYFSRAAIPHSREGQGDFYHHIGIYAYKISTLKKLISLPESPLEKLEKLEQLRALENKIEIMVKVIDGRAPISVDTTADLQNVINQL